jgi:hypothetical protein
VITQTEPERGGRRGESEEVDYLMCLNTFRRDLNFQKAWELFAITKLCRF